MEELAADERRLLLGLARGTLEAFFNGREPEVPAVDSPALLVLRATFVTLRSRGGGELRGCRGETRARRSLLASVVHTTLASATDDPRFEPIVAEELEDLAIQISALGPLRRIDPAQVELGRHGLLVVRGSRSGLLLPQVPGSHGLETVAAFLAAVCRKADLPEDAWRDSQARLFGFEAEHWGDEAD